MTADEVPGYLHGHHDSVLRSHRWRTAQNSAAYLLEILDPSATILDIGCGPGTVTADLASRVAPGRTIGLDQSVGVLSEARAGAPGVSFIAGDLFELPLADASVDVVHLHQVLQHLDDPVAALRSLRRVIRPGGLLAARDADYGAMTWSPEITELDAWNRLYHLAARQAGGEPDAGRHLAAWASQAGFEDVTSSESTWVFDSPEDRAWWGTLWADRVLSSNFAVRVLAGGLATTDEVEAMAEAWRRFAVAPSGWFRVPSGEILCRFG